MCVARVCRRTEAIPCRVVGRQASTEHHFLLLYKSKLLAINKASACPPACLCAEGGRPWRREGGGRGRGLMGSCAPQVSKHVIQSVPLVGGAARGLSGERQERAGSLLWVGVCCVTLGPKGRNEEGIIMIVRMLDLVVGQCQPLACGTPSR